MRRDVSVYIDDIAPDVELNELLERPYAVSWTRQRREPGLASFSLLWNDPQVAKIRQRTRIALVHRSGTVLFSGRVSTIDDDQVELADGLRAAVTYTLEGDLADAATVRVRPWSPVVNASRLDLAARPVETTRRIGWRDPIIDDILGSGLDGVTWSAATELFLASSQLGPPDGRSGHPVGFPQDAWWIWSEPIGGDGTHPQGDRWFHRDFNVSPSAQGIVVYVAGDDAYDVWLDGINIAATANNDADDAFLKTKRVIINRTGAEMGPNHHLIVRALNEGPGTFGDIGGFLCVIREKGTGTLITATSSAWECCVTEPGVPVTAGLLSMWDEVADRDVANGELSATSYLNWDITNSTGSDGLPVPLVPDAPIPEGSSFGEVLSNLADVWIDYDVPPTLGPPSLKVVAAAGVPVVGGGTGVGLGSTTTLRIEEGRNARELRRSETVSGASSDTYANCIVYRWRGGWGEVKNIAPGALRVEHYVTFGDDLDANDVAVRAGRILEFMSQPRVSFTCSYEPVGADPVAGINFDVNDRVTVVHRGTDYVVPVTTITGQMDDRSGVMTTALELGESREVIERTFEAWLTRSAKGLGFDQASPGRPGEIDVTFIEPEQIEFGLGVTDEPADGATTNQQEVTKRGRVGLLTMESHSNAATSTAIFQLYVNGVAAETCTLFSGQWRASAYYALGTAVGPGSKVRGVMTSWGGLKDVTVTLTFFEVV